MFMSIKHLDHENAGKEYGRHAHVARQRRLMTQIADRFVAREEYPAAQWQKRVGESRRRLLVQRGALTPCACHDSVRKPGTASKSRSVDTTVAFICRAQLVLIAFLASWSAAAMNFSIASRSPGPYSAAPSASSL